MLSGCPHHFGDSGGIYLGLCVILLGFVGVCWGFVGICLVVGHFLDLGGIVLGFMGFCWAPIGLNYLGLFWFGPFLGLWWDLFRLLWGLFSI